jgi:hypothetical protein
MSAGRNPGGSLPSVADADYGAAGGQEFDRTVASPDASFVAGTITLPSTYRPKTLTISATVAAIFRITYPDGRTKDVIVNGQYPISLGISKAFPAPTQTLNVATKILAPGSLTAVVGYST